MGVDRRKRTRTHTEANIYTKEESLANEILQHLERIVNKRKAELKQRFKLALRRVC